MIVLLLPLVAAILFCEHKGFLYPEEKAIYDSLYVYRFVLTSENHSTARYERYEAQTYGGKVYAYILRDSLNTLFHPGDTIIATTRIRKPDSIGSFDYRKYLLRKGIIGSAFIYRYEARRTESYSPTLQKRLYERLSSAGLEEDELATTGAITLGYKEDLDPAVKHRFQASGAAHVLAVSGLHTGIIYLLVIGLLTIGGRFKPHYDNRLGRCLLSVAVLCIMWLYAWITGMTPSVVRAVVMVTMVEIGRMFYRQGISVNSIAAAAFFILLVRPLDLWSVGFQLSFAATFAIVLLANQSEKKLHLRARNRLLNWLIGTVIVSIAAQLGTLPLTIYYFGYVSTYFLLTNLIVLPIDTFLVPAGLISIALGGSTAGIWIGKITHGLAWLMNHSVGWIESLPYSTLPAHASMGMVAIYYVLLLLLCFTLYDE